MTLISKTILLITTTILIASCGFFGPEEPDPAEQPAVERQMVPTFTPTATLSANQAAAPAAPAQAAAEPTPIPPTAIPVEESAQPIEPLPTEPAPTEPEPTEPEPTELPATEPKLIVNAEIINIRSGPSTAHALVGAANQGQSFDLTGKNELGDWWEICCVNGQAGWVFGPLAQVENAELVTVAQNIPTPPPAPTAAPVVEAPPEPAAEPAAEAAQPEAAAQPGPPPDPGASSEGWFDPNAQYHVTNLRVLGLGENNGGIRDSSALHYILITVLDENGNPAEGAVVKNLVGDKLDHPTGNKGPGRTEITMYWEPYKLTVASDASGPVTSQVSNQMGLAFPHLPDIVGKLGDENYEYGKCPTLEIRCEWPIQAVHFSYEITFQKMR